MDTGHGHSRGAMTVATRAHCQKTVTGLYNAPAVGVPLQAPRPALGIRGSLLAEAAGPFGQGSLGSAAASPTGARPAGARPSRLALEGWKEAATSLLGPSRMPGPLTAFPLSFFTLGLTGVYGFGGPYGETVATGAYRAFRVAAAAGHSGAFSGNDSNRTSKFQGGNYTQTPFLRASGNGFLHCTGWSEAFLLTPCLPNCLSFPLQSLPGLLSALLPSLPQAPSASPPRA